MIGPFFYKVRLSKGAPYSGVKVWHDFPVDPVTGETLVERSPRWYAELNGEHTPIEDVMIEFDGVTGVPVIKGDVCPEAEYRYLSDVVQWAQRYAPAAPEAKPRERVDLNKLPPIFGRK